MLHNYLNIALRNLLRQKSRFFLNSIGLTVGFTFAGLIGSYVRAEFQVKWSLRHAGQQYPVRSRQKANT